MSAMPPTLHARPLTELLDGFAEGVPALAVTDLSIDSRAVRPGGAFLAVRGTREHGLRYLPQALANGASAVLWEPAPGIDAPQGGLPAVAVPHLARRAGAIAARFFGHPSRSVACVGVTGTDGKTSTAWLVAQALDRLDRPALYLGTLGTGRVQAIEPGDHTTPDPVSLQRRLAAARDAGLAACAMEVSSHALDQARVGGIEFAVAVLTNVGRDHLDYHGTLEAYAAAKQKLFTDQRPAARVLNRDDAAGRDWAELLAGPQTLVYGLDGAAPAGPHAIGRGLELRADGIAFGVDTHRGPARIESRLLGRFNAYNLLAAFGALLMSGVAPADAARALSASSTVPGRIEGFRGARGPLVVVDYAHTPQALAQILQAVRAHCPGRLWAVFGCGGDRDRGKRPLMGAAAAQHADRLIVTDDNPRSEDPQAITDEILSGLTAESRAGTRVIHDRAEAIRTAVREAAADDVIVLAGKGHETTQTYGREARPFSDREFVARLLQEAR